MQQVKPDQFVKNTLGEIVYANTLLSYEVAMLREKVAALEAQLASKQETENAAAS